MDESTEAGAADGDYVAFFAAGEHVVGEFRCSECGYGVCVYRVLPRCPMCHGSAWEPTPSRVLQ